MNGKRWIALLLAAALAAALAGCAKQPAQNGGENTTQTQTPTGSATDPVTPDPPQPPEPPEPTVATLAVFGDVITHMRIVYGAQTAEGYDFRYAFAAAKPYIESADYAVGNLETTMSGGPNYSGYPAFNAPDELAEGLRDLGTDLLLTANNHCMDKGFAGLKRTLDVLDAAGIAHVGTHRTAEEAENDVVLADVGGIRVAFLGYTYGTNGIPLPKDAPFAVNLFNTDYLTSLSTLDRERVLASLERAKAMEPDLIAVMIHWGVEYQTKQNRYQDEVAQFLFDNGADIILGGHSHVPQPMALRTIERGGVTKQGFVCYSLGNFISCQPGISDLTDTTAVLQLELTRDNVTGLAEVSGVSYVPMTMMDFGASVKPQFVLWDTHAALDDGATGAGARKALEYSLAGAHRVFGANYDAYEIANAKG